MTRNQFVSAIANVLRESGARKSVHIPKNEFTITDNEGNVKKFTVKRRDKNVLFTAEDVEYFLDACIEVIKSVLKTGDKLTLRNIGSIGLSFRKGRKIVNVRDGKEVEFEDRYVPKAYFGNELKACGHIYKMSLDEKLNKQEPNFDDEIEAALEEAEE